MDATTTQCKVKQCFNCPGDTGYLCKSCPCDMCFQCKVNHVEDLKTIDHNVVIHGEKSNHIVKQEICARHPGNTYRNYCKPCKLPLCYQCRKHSKKHRKHRQQAIKKAYETKRQQHRKTIHTIRSDALFYRHIFLTGIERDIQTCVTEYSIFQSKVSIKAKRLKALTDYVIKDLMYNVFAII